MFSGRVLGVLSEDAGLLSGIFPLTAGGPPLPPPLCALSPFTPSPLRFRAASRDAGSGRRALLARASRSNIDETRAQIEIQNSRGEMTSQNDGKELPGVVKEQHWK